jgi:hypothetical protein
MEKSNSTFNDADFALSALARRPSIANYGATSSFLSYLRVCAHDRRGAVIECCVRELCCQQRTGFGSLRCLLCRVATCVRIDTVCRALQTKGTASYGKRNNKTHVMCRRCNKRSFQLSRCVCEGGVDGV